MNVLTPPSSNEDSSFSPTHYNVLSPQYNNLDHMDINDESYNMSPRTYVQLDNSRTNMENRTHLVITEQPTEKFRFRYKSEMAGTHGSINGSNSDKSRKQTFPTVELRNYNRPAKIRCSIYQISSELNPHMPHAHRLVLKQGNNELDDPHHKHVSQTEGFVATFPGMGIIHTAKKYVYSEILKKKTELWKEDIARETGVIRNLNKSEEMKVKALAESESKSINLNTVVLKFEAFSEDNGILRPLCEPVFSNHINNLKSALTGELKIVRMDHCTGSSKGGKEVILLVEKVTKKNIKIRFFELDDNGLEVWEDFGKFNDLDVHHQYAIVFRTPRYKEIDIDGPRQVFIELTRPSDNSRSEPKEFVYYPPREQAVGKKRPYRSYSSSNSYSFNSADLPVTITNLGCNVAIDSEEIFKNTDNITPEQFDIMLKSVPDLVNFFPQERDALYANDGGFDRVTMRSRTSCLERVYDEMLSLLRSKPKKQIVLQQLEFWFTSPDFLTENGETALHLAVLENNYLKFCQFLKLITNMEMGELLKIKTTGNGQTVLHLATQLGYVNYVTALLRVRAERHSKHHHLPPSNNYRSDSATNNTANNTGNYSSAGNNASNNTGNNVGNNAGNQGLLIAQQDNNYNTVLHYAVKLQPSDVSVQMLTVLLAHCTDRVVNMENEERFTALFLAVKINNITGVKLLCERGANVNVKNHNSNHTILHVAIMDRNVEIVEYLIKYTSIDLLAKDCNDYSPYKHALYLNGGGEEGTMRRITEMIKESLNERGINTSIKEEIIEAESEEEEEMEIEEVIIKQETIEDSAYENIVEFTSTCLEDLSGILNQSKKWETLAELLDLSHLLSTNLLDKNPTKVLLNNAVADGTTILQIKNHLLTMNENEAVERIEKMIISSKVA